MNQLQGNKLIAEFLGWTYLPEDEYVDFARLEKGYEAMSASAMQYHTSWDWQVPVWAKIALEVKTWLVGRPEDDIKHYFRTVGRYEEAIFQNNPLKGHLEIVELIQWYIQNK